METNVNCALIKELRLKKSWSQEKLADIAGVSLRTIQRIETHGVASLQSRSAIANAFELEPAELSAKEHGLIETKIHKKLYIRLLSTILREVKGTLRGFGIFLASIFSIGFFAMALLKFFVPNNVGLFTRGNSFHFGIVQNTTDMQEHLGNWVIPLTFVAGWLLFRCVILLIGGRNQMGKSKGST